MLGFPPLAVWRSAHTGQRPLSTSTVLGSPPWLFEHRLATNKRRGSKAGASSPRRPPPYDAGTATECRLGVAQVQHMIHPGHRLPAGSLHSARGRDSAKTQAGPGRALAPTSQGLTSSGQSHPGRQCTVNHCARIALGGGDRGLQAQSQVRTQAQQQDQQQECGGGRFAASDSRGAACAPWSEDQEVEQSRRRSALD